VQSGRFREDLFYRLNVLPVLMPPLRDRGEDVLSLLSFFIEKANIDHGMDEPCRFSADALRTLLRYNWPGNVRQLQNVVERLVVMSGGGVITSTQLPREILEASQIHNVVIEPEETNRAVTATVANPLFETFPSTSLSKITSSSGNVQLPLDGVDLTAIMEMIENSLIIQALERTGNNKNQAAKLLGLNRTTLVERLKKRRIGFVNSALRDL
jgi:DNA-binding NtrC family response regulator